MVTSKRSRSSGVAVSSKAAVMPPTPPPSTATLVLAPEPAPRRSIGPSLSAEGASVCVRCATRFARLANMLGAVNGADETPAVVSKHDLAMVRRGYELWNDGDIRGLADTCFTEDVEWHAAPEWPGERLFRGREEVERFLREDVAELIALQDTRIERIEQVGPELVITLQARAHGLARDRKSTRLNSSHRCISYAVFCLKKK